MKNIIFIAPPAAGKGTISNMICSKYNIPHISTGDLLRDEIAASTKIGLEIKESMALGKFVSDEVITKLLKKRLANKDCRKGFILDGYPRNIHQAKIYDDLLKELECDMGTVIFLDITKEEALSRINSRMVCPKCGMSYNLSNKELSPVREGLCDNCSSKLVTRSDDTEETFIDRFDTYMRETYPLIEYYESANNLIRIEVGGKTPDEIFKEVEKVIK